MKHMIFGALAAALFVTGCQKESSKGGPGANVEDSKNVFSIKVPKTAVDVKQGQEQKVTITLDRGKEFDQTVKLSFELPKGVEITPDDAEMKKGQTEREFSLKADKDADVGEHAVKVTGKPETGEATTVSFTVKIEKVEKLEKVKTVKTVEKTKE